MKAIIYSFRPDDPLNEMGREFADLDWKVARSIEDVAAEIRDVDILILSNRVCCPELGACVRENSGPSLRWIHVTSAGIERTLAMGLPNGIVLTNAAGVKATTIAEHAMTLLLCLGRRIPDLAVSQREHEWSRLEINPRIRSLGQKTACLFGMGAVGRDIARKLKAFDANVVAVSRQGEQDSDFDRVFRREQMLEALGLADAVVVCTSSDAQSFHMLGKKQFDAMRPGALFVNVARGEIIDEAALVAALQSGRLGGAGLDVAEVEPLPTNSALWDLPNVIITPHVSGGGSTGYASHVVSFGRNLELFAAGRRLVGEIATSRQ
jgi:phosphoglycerate dehydrogenase-like enzyme